MFKHSQSPVEESRLLTSTAFILELPTNQKHFTTALTIMQTEIKSQHAHELRIKKKKKQNNNLKTTGRSRGESI